MNPFVLDYDGDITAKKSRKDVSWNGGFHMFEPKKAARSQRALEWAIRAQLRGVDVLFPSESVDLRVFTDKSSGHTRIEVVPLGPRPKKFTGRKRDIQNELQTICDALEEAGVVRNDNQIGRIVMERLVGGEVR